MFLEGCQPTFCSLQLVNKNLVHISQKATQYEGSDLDNKMNVNVAKEPITKILGFCKLTRTFNWVQFLTRVFFIQLIQIQVNNYENVINFFRISHSLT